MANNFIQLSRSFLDWEWYDDRTMVKLFLHLFLKAKYTPVRWHGTWIERGSLITSSRILSIETGISAGQVRTCLERLQKSGEIRIQTTNKYSYVTMLRYDEWQGIDTKDFITTISALKNDNINCAIPKKKRKEKQEQPYTQLMKSPQWQKKRLEILERDGFKCVKCGRDDKSLHVHHLYYKKDTMPWDYSNDALITLCEKCHKEAHKNDNK